jgi:hypothetical protein
MARQEAWVLDIRARSLRCLLIRTQSPHACALQSLSGFGNSPIVQGLPKE